MSRHQQFNWKATAAVFIVAISAVLVFNYSLPYLFPSNEPTYQNNVLVQNITVTINYKNTTVEKKAGLRLNSTSITVFDIMVQNFTVAYSTTGDGRVFITKINGAENGWTYTLDGVFATVACNRNTLNNNSIVEWTQA